MSTQEGVRSSPISAPAAGEPAHEPSPTTAASGSLITASRWMSFVRVFVLRATAGCRRRPFCALSRCISNEALHSPADSRNVSANFVDQTLRPRGRAHLDPSWRWTIKLAVMWRMKIGGASISFFF